MLCLFYFILFVFYVLCPLSRSDDMTESNPTTANTLLAAIRGHTSSNGLASSSRMSSSSGTISMAPAAFLTTNMPNHTIANTSNAENVPAPSSSRNQRLSANYVPDAIPLSDSLVEVKIPLPYRDFLSINRDGRIIAESYGYKERTKRPRRSRFWLSPADAMRVTRALPLIYFSYDVHIDEVIRGSDWEEVDQERLETAVALVFKLGEITCGPKRCMETSNGSSNVDVAELSCAICFEDFVDDEDDAKDSSEGNTYYLITLPELTR